jgi:predicted nucleotidyltransferase component of viral defense system
MQEAALKRLAGKCKVPVGTVEKDYILSLMLVILSNSDLASTIVFKGGTAIKKIYYPEARFSEDLDFDYFDLDPEDIKTILRDIPTVNPFESVEFLEIKDELLSGDKYSCRMNYAGPLKYRNSIKLDFSGKDRVLREPKYRAIKDDYHSWEECACVYLRPGLQRNDREGVPYEYTCEQGIRGLVNFTTFADCRTCDLFTPGSNLREKNGYKR